MNGKIEIEVIKTFHAPIASSMSSGLQGIIHWILGVWWKGLEGKVSSSGLPRAFYYSPLVFWKLTDVKKIDLLFCLKDEKKEMVLWNCFNAT